MIRPVNLLIVAGTMLVLMHRYSDEQNSRYWQMAVLMIVPAVLTAAAGYIVNDIFDIETDKINRPDRVIIGNLVSKKQAWILYVVLNLISFGLAYCYSPKFFRINMVIAFILYLYSYQLKGTPLLGNLVVAFCSAGVLATCMLHIRFETTSATWNFLGYVIFAFFISVIREMVKDMQDYEGDKQAGLKTYPVVFGIKGAKVIVYVLTGIEIILCGLYSFLAWGVKFYVSSGIMALITLALMYFINSLARSKTSEAFGKESQFLKYVMFAGVINILFS